MRRILLAYRELSPPEASHLPSPLHCNFSLFFPFFKIIYCFNLKNGQKLDFVGDHFPIELILSTDLIRFSELI